MRQLKQKEVPKLRKWILKKKQKGICPICKKKVDAPCLDHHHVKKVKGTGQIRGVLCRNCNVFIAKAENNSTRYGISQADLPQILRNTADYLEADQYPYIHPSEAPKPKILMKKSYNKLKKAYTGKAKFPEFRTGKNGKPLQKMTKKLEKLFEQYGIRPEFYGG